MGDSRMVVGVTSTPSTAVGWSPINDWIDRHGTLDSVEPDAGAATLRVETYPLFIMCRARGTL